jgi:hypothetical protein
LVSVLALRQRGHAVHAYRDGRWRWWSVARW